MSQKTLYDLLNKYIPAPEEDDILKSGIVTRSRVDKEKRILEVHANFKFIIPKEKNI